jgi:hypothetical protein
MKHPFPGPVEFTAKERKEAYRGNYGPVKKRLMKMLVERKRLHAALTTPRSPRELQRLRPKE